MILQEIKLYKSDPLLRLLLDRLGLNWWKASLIYLLSWLIDNPGFAWISGTFFPRAGLVSLVDDLPGSFLVVLWTGTVLLVYYLSSSRAFIQMISRLVHSHALLSDDQSVKISAQTLSVLKRIERLWNHPGWVVGALVVAITWLILIFIPVVVKNFRSPIPYWQVVNTGYYIYFLIKIVFWTYIIVRILCIELLSWISIQWLVQSGGLNYQALHYDQAGGLAAIGRNRLGFIYGLLGISLFFIFIGIRPMLGLPTAETVFLGFGPIEVFFIFLIIILFPLAFYIPLLSVHQFMSGEKLKLLERSYQKISHEMNRLLDQNASIAETKLFQDNYHVFHEFRNAPEWPYSPVTLRRFLGSWFTFIGSFVIPFLTEIVVSKLW